MWGGGPYDEDALFEQGRAHEHDFYWIEPPRNPGDIVSVGCHGCDYVITLAPPSPEDIERARQWARENGWAT